MGHLCFLWNQPKASHLPKKMITATDSWQRKIVSTVIYYRRLFCHSICMMLWMSYFFESCWLWSASVVRTCTCNRVKGSVSLPWWRDEGIYPGCSVLTLIVIAHFIAKAYCYGGQNNGPSRVNSFLNFLKWQHCEVWSNGIRGFFFSFLKETFAWTI